MNFAKNIILCAAFCLCVIASCSNIHESPSGCVVAFIVAAEQKDMTKAWNILGPDAQSYFNSQGEKMRKSGKGALENEISKVSKFRTVKKDYKIELDSTNQNIVKIVTIGGPTHLVETVKIDENYKIKDETSIRNLLQSISAELNNKQTY